MQKFNPDWGRRTAPGPTTNKSTEEAPRATEKKLAAPTTRVVPALPLTRKAPPKPAAGLAPKSASLGADQQEKSGDISSQSTADARVEALPVDTGTKVDASTQTEPHEATDRLVKNFSRLIEKNRQLERQLDESSSHAALTHALAEKNNARELYGNVTEELKKSRAETAKLRSELDEAKRVIASFNDAIQQANEQTAAAEATVQAKFAEQNAVIAAANEQIDLAAKKAVDEERARQAVEKERDALQTQFNAVSDLNREVIRRLAKATAPRGDASATEPGGGPSAS